MKQLNGILLSIIFTCLLFPGISKADPYPPFPWSIAEPCAILVHELPGYWVAKDAAGRGLFYLYVNITDVEGVKHIYLRQYTPVINEKGYLGFVLSAEGHGNITSDLATLTGVLNLKGVSGGAIWVYMHSLCAPTTGQRQSVLEVEPVKSGGLSGNSIKYIFEKVPATDNFIFTE